MLARVPRPDYIDAGAETPSRPSERATRVFGWLRRHHVALTATAGVVLVVMGVLVFTGELTALNVEAQRLLDRVGLDGLYQL